MNWKGKLAVVLSLSLIASSAKPALAMLAPAEPLAGPTDAIDRDTDAQKVQTFLEQKAVRARLAEMGLADGQIGSRLGELSDAELHQVALRIDEQNPGGDGSGVVITVLAIGVLVLLFIYLAKRV